MQNVNKEIGGITISSVQPNSRAKKEIILRPIIIILSALMLWSFTSCSPSGSKSIAGKWVSTKSSTTYYEFFDDKTAKVTVTLKNLNTKYYPDGKNTETSTGTWWNTEDGKYKAEINMNGTKTIWLIRLSGDSMFIKGNWAGAEDEEFKKELL